MDEVPDLEVMSHSVIGWFWIDNTMSELRWGSRETTLAGRRNVEPKAFVLIGEDEERLM